MNKSRLISSLVVSIAVPIIGGFLGCGIECSELETENAIWILMFAIPVSLITALFSSLAFTLNHKKKIEKEGFYALTLILLIGSFAYSMHLLENACGF